MSKKQKIGLILVFSPLLLVVILFVQIAVRLLLAGTDPDSAFSIVKTIINIVSILLGIFAFVGWIPGVILLVTGKSRLPTYSPSQNQYQAPIQPMQNHTPSDVYRDPPTQLPPQDSNTFS